MVMGDEVETSGISNYFSKRATFVPKKSAEDLKAASELLSKIEEKKKVSTSFSRKKKGKRMEKDALKSSDSTEDLSDNMSDLEETKLTAAAKRRIKKLKKDQELELQTIEAENQKVLSAMTDIDIPAKIEEPVEEFEKVMFLTVTYISKVSRFMCHENDKFSSIFPKVADFFNLKVTEFLLCFKDRNITVDDTPKSLYLNDTDILECIPYTCNQDGTEVTAEDGMNLRISFQSNDTKSKIEMSVHKLAKMQEIMEQYSKKRNLPLYELKFEFDGESLSGTETPLELDMESGCCIDVIHMIPTPGPSGVKDSSLKKENVMNVITINSDSEDSDIIYD